MTKHALLDSEGLEAAAQALTDIEIGYSIRLMRLVDGVSTYVLTYDDIVGDPLEFDSHTAAYKHVRRLVGLAKAEAAIRAWLSYISDSKNPTRYPDTRDQAIARIGTKNETDLSAESKEGIWHE